MSLFDMHLDCVTRFPSIAHYGSVWLVEFEDYAKAIVIEDAVSSRREQPRENITLQQMEEIL